MNMKFVLYDNQIMPQERVLLSPIDTGILIGDGVFTTLLIRNGIPLFIKEHCERLYSQAKQLNLQTIEISLQSIYELIIQNNAQRGEYRLKLCYLARGDFFQKTKSSILLGILAPYTEVTHPLRLLPYPYPIETPFSHYKTLAYSHRFFLLQWAIKHQFDDVITKDSKGHILETAFANIFWVKDKTLYYPALDLPVFPGITIEIIKKMISPWQGYTIKKSCKQIQDLDSSAQWFITNSLLGIRPVIQIGSVHINQNYALEERLRRGLRKIIATAQK